MDDSQIEKEVYKALSLLRSTDESSGQKLRLMLDSLIQEKFGFQKTVTSRVSKKILKKAETLGKPQNVSPGMIESIKIFTTNFYDSGEQDDVPRISIPDEGSEESISHMKSDSNLENLEGIFLLECQNCLEIYQPLYNQTSIDIDDFNTELKWLCKNCSQHKNQTKNFKTYSNRMRVCPKFRRSTMKIPNGKN